MCEVPFTSIHSGTYEGLQSVGEQLRKIVFRWEKATDAYPDEHLYSADFFVDDLLETTIRGRIKTKTGACGNHTACRFFLNQAEQTAPFPIEIHTLGKEEVAIHCALSGEDTPWEMPMIYQGPYFRKMTIRIAYMASVPTPQAIPFEEFFHDDQKTEAEGTSFEHSLEKLFERMGIHLDVSVHPINEEHFSFNTKVYRDCPERLLWDEKALHQLMMNQFPDTNTVTDWVANLLLLRGHYGTYAAYDLGSRTALQKTAGLMFDRRAGWQLAGPSIERFYNMKPRQGAAVFWDPLLKKIGKKNNWQLQREFTFLMVHEIGHILNLRHAPSCFDLTYMNYPDFYCEGRNEFWQKFGFIFTREERNHLFHGFLPEVLPGGKVSFPIIRNQAASAIGLQPNNQPLLFAKMSKPVFETGEPAILELTIHNPTQTPMAIPALDPAYGDLEITVTHPDQSTSLFNPPVYKCMVEKNVLQPKQTHRFAANIAINQEGFWLEEAGEYTIAIKTTPHTLGDAPLFAKAAFHRQEIPQGLNHQIFSDPKAAHFLYFNGMADDTTKTRWQQFVEDHPKHPICGLVHSALGLAELPICPDHPSPSTPPPLTPAVKSHLAKAIEFGELPMTQRKTLMNIYEAQPQRPSGRRGFTTRLRNWVLKFKRLFIKPQFKDFLGTHHMQLTFGKGGEAQKLDAVLTLKEQGNQAVSFKIEFPQRPHHNLSGEGQFDKGHRLEAPEIHLKAINPETGNEFEAKLHFAISIFKRKLFLTGKVKTGGGGGSGGTVVSGNTGTSGSPPPPNTGG